jgi:hypothetical protein
VGKHCDNDALGACLLERFGGLTGSASCRQDVVNQQNGLSVNPGVSPGNERSTNVIPAGGCPALRLAGGIADPAKHIRTKW